MRSFRACGLDDDAVLLHFKQQNGRERSEREDSRKFRVVDDRTREDDGMLAVSCGWRAEQSYFLIGQL